MSKEMLALIALAPVFVLGQGLATLGVMKIVAWLAENF